MNPLDPPASYDGPRELAHSLSAFARSTADDAAWNREGLRPDNEYRELGLAAATGGKIGVKHIRAIAPFPQPTGWHWHDMTAHFVYVLKGWVKFRYQGVDDEVRVAAGTCLSQPAGVPHNVVGQSDDLELIEINMPANYATLECAP